MTEMAEVAFWVYPWDLADEGIPTVLDRLKQAGADTFHVATIYHAGKFLHVHNPKRKVVFPRSGTLYFPPDPDWHGKLRIEPPTWSEGPPEFWSELREQADEHDLEVSAWVLCLHNSGIGTQYPDCTVENAYGDRIVTDLCPSHPDVREFLLAQAESYGSLMEAREAALDDQSGDLVVRRREVRHVVMVRAAPPNRTQPPRTSPDPRQPQFPIPDRYFRTRLCYAAARHSDGLEQPRPHAETFTTALRRGRAALRPRDDDALESCARLPARVPRRHAPRGPHPGPDRRRP